MLLKQDSDFPTILKALESSKEHLEGLNTLQIVGAGSKVTILLNVFHSYLFSTTFPLFNKHTFIIFCCMMYSQSNSCI